MKRFLWLGFVLSLYVICSGCGDTFRPIIIPNPPVFPNPRAAHTVVSINDNAPLVNQSEVVVGSAMVIDVSGDTDVSVANVGLAPVHAVQQSANQILVVNHSVTGQNTRDSLTQLTFFGTTINSASTISLPPNSAPNFVAVAPSSRTAYVTLTALNEVGVVSTLSDSLVATIPVGANPYALAVTPNDSKVYVANQGDSTVGGFNVISQSLTQRVGSPASTTSPPIWLVSRSDNQRVFVLEQNGILASLDTTSTAGPDTLTESTISVPGATTMTYDSNLNRLYIPGGQEMEIVDISQSQPQSLATILIPQFTLLNLPPVNATAVAAAALPDGSRAYVASYATLPSQLVIPSVSGDGTIGTYAYTLTAGYPLNAGVTVTVSGTGTGFDGQFIVSAIVSGTTACPGTCFQAANATSGTWPPPGTSGPAFGTGSNIFPQVTVVDATSNTIKTTAAVPGFPDATLSGSPYYVPVCASTRFRFMMAAGGDSTRAYLSSCDGGNVNVIDTTTDTYILNLQAPVGVRPPISGSLNPPQNPVFLIAGP
jgi:DNA-binding beta-propeller fold protein YncE